MCCDPNEFVYLDLLSHAMLGWLRVVLQIPGSNQYRSRPWLVDPYDDVYQFYTLLLRLRHKNITDQLKRSICYYLLCVIGNVEFTKVEKDQTNLSEEKKHNRRLQHPTKEKVHFLFQDECLWEFELYVIALASQMSRFLACGRKLSGVLLSCNKMCEILIYIIL